MKKSIFYRNHPEAQKGEVLATFIGEPYIGDVKWETKRAGETFYNESGHPVVPVFIQESEMKDDPDIEVRDWPERPEDAK